MLLVDSAILGRTELTLRRLWSHLNCDQASTTCITWYSLRELWAWRTNHYKIGLVNLQAGVSIEYTCQWIVTAPHFHQAVISTMLNIGPQLQEHMSKFPIMPYLPKTAQCIPATRKRNNAHVVFQAANYTLNTKAQGNEKQSRWPHNTSHKCSEVSNTYYCETKSRHSAYDEMGH